MTPPIRPSVLGTRPGASDHLRVGGWTGGWITLSDVAHVYGAFNDAVRYTDSVTRLSMAQC